MRVLVVCQHYWPEPFNTSDVCEGLAARGHEVTVLTGLPNVGMPGNEIPSEYKADRSLRREKRNGVDVVRSWLWPRRTGAANRVLNYLSFWYCANRASEKLDDDFDVVLGYQLSPVTQVDPAVRYAERTGAPLLLYSFDLWPESLVAGGVARGSLPFEWMRRVSARIYGAADVLAATSPGFFGYFESELGVVPPRRLYLPQYAEDLFGEAPGGEAPGVDEGLFPDGLTHFMFAGNVGRAQSVGTIVDAAGMLRGEPVRFHVVGSGSDLGECVGRARERRLENVVFHGRRDLGEMPAYYSKADAMLATLAGSPLIAYTLPRKVQTYLAASKPVIGTLEGEGRRVVEEARCGLCCDVGDAAGLAEICRRFADMSPAEREAMGANGRRYYEEHYSKELFFDALEGELESMKGRRHGS